MLLEQHGGYYVEICNYLSNVNRSVVGTRSAGAPKSRGGPWPPKHAMIISSPGFIASSFKELIDKAEVIVVGTAEKAIGRLRPNSDTIETDVFVLITRVLKGAESSDKRLIVEQLGGTFEDRTLIPLTTQPIKPGDTYIFFLRRDRRPLALPIVAETNRYTMLNDGNGQFRVKEGKVQIGEAAPSIRQHNDESLDAILSTIRAQLN